MQNRAFAVDKKSKREQALWISTPEVDINQNRKTGYVQCVDNSVQTVHRRKDQRNQGREKGRKKTYTQKKKNLSTGYQQTVDKLRQPDKLSTPVDNSVDKKWGNYPQSCAENRCCGGKNQKYKKFKDLLDESRFFEYN